MPISPNLRGALFMSISMAGFTVNDSISKIASAEMNMGQVMLVRGLFATALIGTIVWSQGALKGWTRALHPLVILRAFGEAVATVFFLIALSHLPLGNISAVMQALPLAVTMGAALFFGEQVGWRRWLAIIAGFTGVLIIIRPGFDGFSVYALLALVSVAFCTLRDLTTKTIPSHIHAPLVSLTTSVFVTTCGALLIQPMGGWSPMSTGMVGLLATAAALLLIGYQFIIMAMRIGDISFVAPFRYTALLWALVLGYVIFSDIPDTAMTIGASIVVGSGLYTLYRERVVGRGKPAADSTTPNMAPDGL